MYSLSIYKYHLYISDYKAYFHVVHMIIFISVSNFIYLCMNLSNCLSVVYPSISLLFNYLSIFLSIGVLLFFFNFENLSSPPPPLPDNKQLF